MYIRFSAGRPRERKVKPERVGGDVFGRGNCARIFAALIIVMFLVVLAVASLPK